jgi:CBS domain containing-hemolysin-like protein
MEKYRIMHVTTFIDNNEPQTPTREKRARQLWQGDKRATLNEWQESLERAKNDRVVEDDPDYISINEHLIEQRNRNIKLGKKVLTLGWQNLLKERIQR